MSEEKKPASEDLTKEPPAFTALDPYPDVSYYSEDDSGAWEDEEWVCYMCETTHDNDELCPFEEDPTPTELKK